MVRGPGRVKGGKGKRWKKGQSSSTNPVTRSHRQVARSGFFHQRTGESGLTERALQHHNQSLLDSDGDAIIQDGDHETVSVGSYRSFMSGLSDCTNPTFDKVKQLWDNNSASHKEICAVLAAVTEVIRSQGGQETETEYFAALVSSRTSTLSCLANLLRVQEPVIWAEPSTLHSYHAILSFTIHPKPKVRKAAQHAVCAVLKGSAFMTHGAAPPYHPAASSTAKFCIQQIEETGGAGEPRATLHVLGLLKDILGVFPQTSLRATCETLLRVMTLSNVLITSCAMQALHGMFMSKPKSSSLPADLNAQLINALYDYQPNENDVQPILAWLAVMQTALCNLQRLDERLCVSHLPRLFTSAMKCLASEKIEITKAASHTLKELLNECVKPAAGRLEAEVKSSPPGSPTAAYKMFKSVENGLGYKYHASWGLVLQTLGVFFQVFGRHCPPMLKKCLQSMADLRSTHHFLYIYDLDKAVGMAIRSMGPKEVLNAIPLQITGDEDNYSFPRSWLLPVLRDNIRETELQFFIQFFLPLAAKLKKKSLEHEQSGRMIESKTYNILQSQIWSLLPGFCNSPTDLCQSFKNIARIMGTVLNERPDLRSDVCAALRLLVNKNINNDKNKNEMKKYSKNFLPILFNIYTTVDATKLDTTRFTVLETIKVYLIISDTKLVNGFLDKTCDKLINDEVTSLVKHAVMDLCIGMVPYIDIEKLNKVYKTIVPLLTSKDKTLQKKSYRILEEICVSSSEASQKFVEENLCDLQKTLLSSLSSSASSSKAPRLRCLIYIVKRLPDENSQFVDDIVSEVILCTKEIGIKARQAAFSLLVEMGNAIIRINQDKKSKAECVGVYIEMIAIGLVGSTTMTSATVLALTRLLYEYKDLIPSGILAELIENVCILLKSRNREVVKSALGFVKVLIIVMSDVALAQHLEKLINSMVTWSSDSKHHFRFKVKNLFGKLMKKFGAGIVFKMVPESYHKMLRNTQKIREREKKRRSIHEAVNAPDDDRPTSETPHAKIESIEDLLRDTDSEDEEPEKEKPQSKKKKQAMKKQQNAAWLQEDAEQEPLDFLDPGVSKKVLATKPVAQVVDEKSTGVKHDFKTSSDGRLIITLDEEEGDEGKQTKRKRKPKDEVDELDELMDETSQSKPSRKRKLEDNSDDELPVKYKAGGGGIHRPMKSAKRRGDLTSGVDFKAKKAGGDMKKKGKPDPYAYIPLDFKQLNRRKKAKSAGQWKSIVHAAKRGANKGMKIKGQKRKGKK
uniref:RRP12-like protein-like n=1 Tax=Saccoglossus kowalevskii TaxID=10224 RepID=A0ABM0MKZ8_SACKO|nr:PREDICTED: RRP12-like protein-like [Saccoglossus kowalevskii]